jgi:citryl-CoA lyase
MEKWKTAISTSTDGGAIVRGHKLNDLVGNKSFSEVAWLLLRGELPNEKERKVFDALLVAMIEHTIAVPSVMAARTVQSAGNTANASIAAGILAIGDHHGGAIEHAGRFFVENKGKDPGDAVQLMLKAGKRIPGYGHKLYTVDPRVQRLLEVLQKEQLPIPTVLFAQQVEKALAETGKTLPLNIDGIAAAVLVDLGFQPSQLRSIFIIARVVGIAAHVNEESAEKPYRRLDDADWEYTGKKF